MRQNFQIGCKMAMEGVPGSLGTRVGCSLRFGQTLFSCASLLFMSLGVEFYSYTAFCYLVTIMGLVIPWSFTLALVDGYSVLVRCPVRQPGVLVIIAAGDWRHVPRLVSWISFSTPAGPFALPSVAVDINSRLSWLFSLGFCLWLQLFSIFGYYPPCNSLDYHADPLMELIVELLDALRITKADTSGKDMVYLTNSQSNLTEKRNDGTYSALLEIETCYPFLFTRHKELLEYLIGLRIHVRK
ncbi:CASP-like protein 5C1 [Hibiscus syriacus]|uniref:CASP-like protein n=1 Tax=Hibiscus syriacus TaxID=106335 RepID=A0A6A3BRV8_HIBSY|nr:CASP-like protein 5C1 [Hibiscus syriacus]